MSKFLKPGEWGKIHDKLIVELNRPVRLPFVHASRQQYLEILEQIAREQFHNAEPIVLPPAPFNPSGSRRWRGPGYTQVSRVSTPKPWWKFW